MEMAEEDIREQRAREYFRKGYNCCQSVALAFSDILGLPEEKISAITSGFGGGMGRLREVCGAVSGMTFLAGAIRPASDPECRENRAANYALVQEFASTFREKYGSIVCRELLQLRSGLKEGTAPSERTEEYYKTRPCELLVGFAARTVARRIF